MSFSVHYGYFMKTNQTYHIDVTEEESKLFADEIPLESIQVADKKMFGKTFWVVVGVHVVVLAGVAYCSSPSQDSFKKSESNQAEDLATLHSEDKEYVKQQPIAQPEPQVTQIAEPIPEATPAAAPSPTPEQKKDKPPTERFVKVYIVKQGDTIYSIAKKYKLNTKRLLDMNGIKDQNKITVGQNLKFM